MKKTILVTSLMLLLAAAPAMAQMMGGGQQMMGGQDAQSSQQVMEQQQMQQTAPTGGQYYSQHMNRGMMGGYGQGMGPQMMGTGTHPCMSGYGYGMHPGTMGGHGYGMHPGMMGGGYGYGRNPGMMGGYGMGPGMMGYYSPEQYEKQFKEHQDFLDESRELRKKLHTLKFDFTEARRNPETKRDDLDKINAEMETIFKQIYEKKKSVVK